MPRPAKEGEKKEGGFSISSTPTEKASVQARASALGFRSVGKYFLALHEAEQRLGLSAESSFAGERWFMATSETTKHVGAPVPEDITVDDAIRQKWEDRVQKRIAQGGFQTNIQPARLAGQRGDQSQKDAAAGKGVVGKLGRKGRDDAKTGTDNK